MDKKTIIERCSKHEKKVAKKRLRHQSKYPKMNQDTLQTEGSFLGTFNHTRGDIE